LEHIAMSTDLPPVEILDSFDSDILEKKVGIS